MPKIVTFEPEQVKEIVRLYNRGMTVAGIARLNDCSPTPIFRVLRDNDVPLRNQGTEPKPERNEHMLDMAEKGYSLEDIARTFNVSRQRVHQIVSRGY
jgi:hypothetical protein